MNNQIHVGANRTGIATSPKLSNEMVQGTLEFQDGVSGDGVKGALVRQEYGRSAEPQGSVPPPTKLSVALRTVAQKALGNDPIPLLDKLGERLAFERAGVRLYTSLLTKFDALGTFEGGPARHDLAEIKRQEFEHFELLHDAIVKLGGDPTAVTPSANLHATLAKGIFEAMADPRTNLVQGLEALLVAELADAACWDTLAVLAAQNGERELASRFALAQTQEAMHVVAVRTWLANALHLGRTAYLD
jgi:hypothetical protein